MSVWSGPNLTVIGFYYRGYEIRLGMISVGVRFLICTSKLNIISNYYYKLKYRDYKVDYLYAFPLDLYRR